MKEYTNQELERLKALQRDFISGEKVLADHEKEELILYLNDTAKIQAKNQNAVVAAINFEQTLKQVLDQHIRQGLTVSQASGVLSLMKTEVEMSYFLRTGTFHEVIQDALFKARIGD